MIGQIRGVERVAEAVLRILEAMRGDEDAPRQQDQHDRESRQQRRARPRDQDERDEGRGREQQPFRLRQRRRSQHDRRDRQQAGVAVDQRAGERDDSQRDEERERDVGEVAYKLTQRRFCCNDREDRGADERRRNALAEERPQRGCEPEREQRELDMDEGSVEGAHRTEPVRLESREQDGMLQRAVRRRREHAVSSAAEVVERACLHRPDRPPVPLDEGPHRESVLRVRQQNERRDERRNSDRAGREVEPSLA